MRIIRIFDFYPENFTYFEKTYTARMNKKSLKKILDIILSVTHITLLILMVVIGLLGIFRPDLIRIGIDWMGIQIKSW